MILLTIIIVSAVGIGISFTRAQKLRKIDIQKQILINGTREEVFEQVVFLSNFPKWSPFLEADPTQKTEVKGTDGQVGAQYHWIGNEGKDLGYQEIKEIVPNQYIKMGCDIQKPFIARPVFEYSFKQMASQVEVTQAFHVESGAIDALFMWLFGTKKAMAKMNQRGLELLKIAVEG